MTAEQQASQAYDAADYATAIKQYLQAIDDRQKAEVDWGLAYSEPPCSSTGDTQFEVSMMAEDYSGLAFAYRDDKQAPNNMDSAISNAQMAIQLQPSLSRFHTQLGDLLRLDGLYQQALGEFNTAIGDAQQHYSESSTTFASDPKPFSTTEAAMQSAQNLRDKDLSQAYTWRGVTYQQIGNHGQAISDLRQATTLDPTNMQAAKLLQETSN